MTRPTIRLFALGVAGLLAAGLAACGTANDEGESSPAGAPAQQVTTTVSPTPTASTAPTTPTTTATTIPTTLPGESFDIGPVAGDVLGVVGVAFDDVLEVLALPGEGEDVVTTLGPLADDAVATGRARSFSSAVWFEVTANGATGWANAAFLAYIGSTTDTTAAVVGELGGVPSAASMLELGGIVAATAASVDDPVSRVTVAVAPSEDGDLGEVTYDVVGLADDSVVGVRLHVFGTPTDADLPRSASCKRGRSR